MSHHHHDEEIQKVVSSNNDNTSRHHHLHLNPTHVIDHIKTKVKQRRFSNKGLPEVSISTTNGDNSNTKRTNDEHNELKPNRSSTKSRSSSFVSPEVIINQDLNPTNENKNSIGIPIEKDENHDTVFDQIEKDEDNSGTVQWRKDRVLSEIDNNQKNTKSKRRLSKSGSKAFSDSINQSNIKKRRQTIRRTVQSSSKKHHNKIKMRDGFDNMGTLSYITGFQIRDEDFNAIFDDLPSDEQLVVSYPCAWRKEMFTQGRMFLSVNYLCFYTCFFKWEESLCIAFTDITSVTREKSVKVLSNAIKLRTNNKEQYVFASFMPRERIFIAIFRLWQNALLEKPLDYQQLRAIVFADQLSIDESTGDSDESVGLENNDEHFPDRHIKSQSISPDSSSKSRKSSTTFIPPDQEMVASSLDKEQLTYVSTCSCDTHLARVIIDRSFTDHVDKLYEFIFGDNAFSRAYHDSQKLTDFNHGEWHMNNETGKRERQITYKTISQSILGTNTVTCTEKQFMEAEIPHSMYVIRTEVYNEGVKYTDAFFIATQYCLFQRDAKHSSLRISFELKYIKNVSGIIKSFIEKNCNTSIDDGINNLVRRLESQPAPKSNQKQMLTRKEHIHKKKDHPIHPAEKKDDSVLDHLIPPNNPVPIEQKSITGKGNLVDAALFVGIFLLLLHIYLCYKLYYIEQLLHTPDGTCINQCYKACLENNFRQ